MKDITRYLAAFLAFAWCIVVATAADSTASKASGAGRYAQLDKLPDWSGIWTLDPASFFAAMSVAPALQGDYARAFDRWQAQVRQNNGETLDTASHCRPPGMPAIMLMPQYPMEFLFAPGRVVTHHEAYMQWRTIHTDGRPHPQELDPSFNGHSIGHWEGSTLVVETIAVKTELPMGMGVPHSDRMRIVERIRLAKDDPDVLRVEMTVEDALALKQPWVRSFSLKRSRGEELIEFVCAENDRNPVNASGKTEFR